MAEAKSVKNTATAEDQQQINKFARLHKAYTVAKQKLAQLDNEAQNLNDAADEVMLLDDADASKVPILVGSVFVSYDQDTVGERLERLKADNQLEMDALRTRIDEMEGELKQLRAVLYAKFGDNIHLEDDEAEDGGEGARNGV